jgi:hypothetical protein
MNINDYINKFAAKSPTYWTMDKAQFEAGTAWVKKSLYEPPPKRYAVPSAIGAGVGAAGAGIANFSSLGKTRNKAMAFGALGGAALGAVFNRRRVQRQNRDIANRKKKYAGLEGAMFARKMDEVYRMKNKNEHSRLH